jgi:CRP/FNR family transcriptional regulator, cyclic AMP receptor protein
MKERFENDYPTLIDALKRQEFVAADSRIAAAFASCGQILEFKKGDEVITQGGEDNDIFLLLAGSVAIVINGSQRNTRYAGQHVGEWLPSNHRRNGRPASLHKTLLWCSR